MAQTRKPEVEERLLRAAAEAFSEHGYQGTSMADIAQRAGLSTGNTYRYFEGKDALFYTLVPDDLAARFLRLVKKRVASLSTLDDVSVLNEDARADAEALLAFWVKHRLEVVILLARAEGSRHAPLRDEFVDCLLRPTRKKLLREAQCERLAPEVELVLRTIFDNTVHVLVAILERYTDEAAIRAAFAVFWRYQLAGLAGLTRMVAS